MPAYAAIASSKSDFNLCRDDCVMCRMDRQMTLLLYIIHKWLAEKEYIISVTLKCCHCTMYICNVPARAS